MDSGLGYFEQVTEEQLIAKFERDEATRKSKPEIKTLPGVFSKGEKLSIKDSLFKITAIGRKGMTLMLLPKESATTKLPAYTADALENSLLEAMKIACKDFELATRIEELVRYVGLNKIKVQWDAEDSRNYGSYLGIGMTIEAHTSAGQGYSYNCDFVHGDARSFDEAEEIMLRAIMNEFK